MVHGSHLAALTLAWLVVQATCPAAAASPVADFAAARTQFEAGRAGSPDATDLAQRLFSRLLSVDANNPLYLAYYGSTFALQARDTRLPWTRIKLINQGNSLLDRALALLDHPQGADRAKTAARPMAAAPTAAAGSAALETRLVAMATFVALPETLFHRLSAAKREYQRALAGPDFATASADMRGHLQFEGALIARQEGDIVTERAALQRVLALSPQSINMAEVRARLAELH